MLRLRGQRMDRPYIEKLRIQSYGCIKDAELKLTPLHALIGPNDSGKSTVLRALRTVVQLAGDKFALGEHNELLPFEPGITRRQLRDLHLGLRWGDFAYEVVDDSEGEGLREVASVKGQEPIDRERGWPATKYGVLRTSKPGQAVPFLWHERTSSGGLGCSGWTPTRSARRAT
jgi:hypothetical protein